MKEHRKALNLSQKELADLLGVSLICVLRWENLKRSIPAYMVIQLEKIFNCNAEALNIIIRNKKTLDNIREGGGEPKTRFRIFCKKNNLTIKKLHSLTGVSARSISGYFCGKIPPPKTQKKIASALGFKRVELFPSDVERYGY